MLAFALVVLQPGTASASVALEAYGRGVISLEAPLAAIHDYTQGLATSWSTTAEFDAGTHNGTTAQDVADALTLARIGPTGVSAPNAGIAWWDGDWNTRECFTVDHTAGATTVTEYPIEIGWAPGPLVSAGLLQADYGDLRAIAADGVTELPVWVESGAATWVQVDTITAGATTSFCLYYGYSPGAAVSPANHGEAAVFTYTTPKPIYYTVSSAYTGTQTVAVASYVDATQIEMDGTSGTLTATLDDGDRGTFGGNTSASEYRVTGPIAGRGVGDGFDTLIPVSWAGTRFVVPSNREDTITSQVLSFYAPFTGGSVEIYAGTDPAPIATILVPPSGTATWTETADEVAAGETIIIEASVPVLAHHATTNGEDATALHPVRSGTWYGVSSAARIGADGDDATGAATGVSVTRSTSGAVTSSLFRGEELVLTGAPGGGGADDGIAVSATGGGASAAIGALSQEDGDGRETITFLPSSELNSRYLLVTDSEYVAVACPSPDVALTVTDGGGTTSGFSCTGASVGHGLLTANRDVTAGRAIEVASSGADFFLAYEDRANGDETNVLGMKQGRQYVWPAPTVGAPSIEGQYPAAGRWESATFDTGAGTEVFGRIDFAGATSAGVTSVEIRVATSDTDPPSSFVGPDGTPATFWSLTDLPSILDYAHDGDRYLRIGVDLSTTDRFGETPTLSSASVDYHLALADRSAGARATVNVGGATGAATTYLFRVRTDSAALDGSTAELVAVTGSNLGNLDPAALRFVNTTDGLDSTQWSTTGTSGVPVGFSSAASHSVVLDHSSVGSGTAMIDFTWSLNLASTTSISVQSDLSVEIATP